MKSLKKFTNNLFLFRGGSWVEFYFMDLHLTGKILEILQDEDRSLTIKIEDRDGGVWEVEPNDVIGYADIE